MVREGADGGCRGEKKFVAAKVYVGRAKFERALNFELSLIGTQIDVIQDSLPPSSE